VSELPSSCRHRLLSIFLTRLHQRALLFLSLFLSCYLGGWCFSFPLHGTPYPLKFDTLSFVFKQQRFLFFPFLPTLHVFIAVQANGPLFLHPVTLNRVLPIGPCCFLHRRISYICPFFTFFSSCRQAPERLLVPPTITHFISYAFSHVIGTPPSFVFRVFDVWMKPE